MHRWANCPGSVKLSVGMPNTSSKYALEGTAAHERAEAILKGKFHAFDLLPEEVEMQEAVMVYVDAIREQKSTWRKLEERFDLSALHPGLFGTSDAVLYFAEEKLLSVWDYKHGQGIAVEVEDNEQLMYYALGALMKFQVPCSHVEMVICQPRAFHPNGPIRKWKVPVTDILDFAGDLIDAAKATEAPNAKIVSGDHCRFCPASPICPELNKQALETAQMEFAPAYSYDPVKLAETLDKLPAIEAWVKAVKEFAYFEAEKGREIPNYKLVPKRAMRKWKADAEETERILLTEFGLDFTEMKHPAELKSVAQIEKVIPKEMKARLEEIVSKESSGSSLVPSKDKRIEVKPSIKTDFTVITATKE